MSLLGPAVRAHAAPRPERITIPGRIVTIAPLSATDHEAALWSNIGGAANSDLWTYYGEGPFEDRDAFNTVLQEKQASEDPLFYSILHNASNRVLGYASLMRIDPKNRVIEVGNIVYSHRLQRTIGATEAMYLLACYVFDTLGYRRYEWKCNSLNKPSRAAALRLGFTYEGLFRQHMIAKGRNRDTSWFSLLDSEWPARKKALEAWLSPSNFDEDGNQRSSLGRI